MSENNPLKNDTKENPSNQIVTNEDLEKISPEEFFIRFQNGEFDGKQLPRLIQQSLF